MAENEVPTGKEWDQAVEDSRSGDPAKAGQAHETLSYDSQQIEKADGGGEEIDLGGPAKEEEKGQPDNDPGVHDHSDGGVHNYEQDQDQDQQPEQEQDEPEQSEPEQGQPEQSGPDLTPEQDQKQDQEQDLDEPEPDQNLDQQQEQGSSIFDQQVEAGDNGDRFFNGADSGDGLLSQLTDHTAQLAEDFMSTEGGHEPEEQQPEQQQGEPELAPEQQNQTGDISAALDNMQQSLGEAQDRVDQSNQRESEMDQQQDKQAQEQSQDQQQDKGDQDKGDSGGDMEMSQ